MQTPAVEVTSSQRRVRIAGTSQSMPYGDLDQMLRDAVAQIARRRGTEPWGKVTDPDTNLGNHGGAAPAYATKPNFTTTVPLHYTSDNNHTAVAFEFVSVDCPTVTAVVWVYMAADSIRSGITLRHLHEDSPHGTHYWWAEGGDWQHPFGYYDSDDDVEIAREWLGKFVPIQGVDWVNSSFKNNPRGAVTAALVLLKQLVDIDQLQLPAWRDRRMPEAMTYRFTGRTTFTKSLYREMLDFVQTSATIDRIRKNYREILKDIEQLGMVSNGAAAASAFSRAVEEGSGDHLVCHMLPLTVKDLEAREALDFSERGPIEIVPDPEHTVAIDLKSGSLVVNCLKDQTDVVEQWNFARFQAELVGELDAFLGFAKQTQNKRNRKRSTAIMKERTTDEKDLEIPKFS